MRLAALEVLLSIAGWTAEIGSSVPDFTVKTLDGLEIRSKALRGSKATVIAFVAAECPVSNAYTSRLTGLYREYAGRGVSFVFVDANSNESAADLRTYVKKARLEFPLFLDAANRLADVLGAQTTPEIFVLDGTGALRYHGAIDDSQNEARVKVRGLHSAIEAVLAGKPVEPERTKAFGCTLHRVRS